APDEAWRMTIMSGAIASRLRTVSSRVSPFVTLDCASATLSVSALKRFSATSNDVRVRVLGSKKRLTTVRPRSVGTFLIGRAAIVDRERKLGAPHDRLRPDRLPHQVVAVERDVERAGGDLVAVDAVQRVRDPPRQRHAARANADQRQIAGAAIAFEDFVGDT